MKKRWITVPLCIVTLLCAVLLAGCAKKPTAEDATAYVQAVMDGICTGKYDGDVSFSDVADGDMARFREDLIDEVLSGFSGQGTALEEETVTLIRSTLSTAFSKCRYTVGEAVKSGNGFDVPVEISPLKLFNVDMETVQTEAVAQLSEDTDLLTLSEDEVVNRVFRVMFGMIAEDLASPTYDDPVSITVHYGALSDGQYGAAESDGKAIGENLFSMEGLQ